MEGQSSWERLKTVISEAVRDHLKKGFDENYGARPLKKGGSRMRLKMPWQKNNMDGKFRSEIQLHLKWMKIILNLSEK